MDDDVDIREQLFHNAVREAIICMLIAFLLYVISYITICYYRRRPDKEDYYSSDYVDALVYRISTWVCTVALAVSLGAVLLLPMSILANESLIIFPKSYYLQWLNSSLIQGLWNLVSLCSNLSLFLFLPFVYLLTESEGFPGSQKGIMSRIKETVLILSLLMIVVFGLAFIGSAFFDPDEKRRGTALDIWNFYLPYLYSCISLFGVFLLLLCTPLGVATLFTVIGDLVVRPQFLRDPEEDINLARLEYQNLLRRKGGYSNAISNGNSVHGSYSQQVQEAHTRLMYLEQTFRVSPWRRNLGYPLVMLLLLALTTTSVFLVAHNTLGLLIGVKALPSATQDLMLGIQSLSALGSVGATVEIGIILYLMLASVVGFYSLPLMHRLRPQLHSTSMPSVIANCAVLLILSSALPVFSRTLGITDFDLLGTFQSIEWLGNLTLVLSYNIIFGVSTTLCLFTKFTATLRYELWKRLHALFLPGILTSSTYEDTLRHMPESSQAVNASEDSASSMNSVQADSKDILKLLSGGPQTLSSSEAAVPSMNRVQADSSEKHDVHSLEEQIQSLHLKQD